MNAPAVPEAAAAALRWGDPAGFAWLLALPAAALLYLAWFRMRPRIAYPGLLQVASPAPAARRLLSHAPVLLRLAAVAALALALARPHRLSGQEEVVSRGISVILGIDVSLSMLAEDFAPDRITAARESAKELVRGLPGHGVGLVVFSGRGFAQCPLTLDAEIVSNFLDQVDCGTVGFDGTAVGEGILTAVNRLQETRARSRVLVLLTDGVNNQGADPRAAARIAAQKGVRIYTIGIGRRGGAQMMMLDPSGQKRPVWVGRDLFGRQAYTYENTRVPAMVEEPDEALLSEIAAATGGKFYRVEEARRLPEIYREIAAMQKDEVRRKRFDVKDELFPSLLLAAAAALALEFLLRRLFAWSPVP